jgi:hypothetical protein
LRENHQNRNKPTNPNNLPNPTKTQTKDLLQVVYQLENTEMSFGGVKNAKPEPVWRQFLFGGLSGCIAATCIFFENKKKKPQNLD